MHLPCIWDRGLYYGGLMLQTGWKGEGVEGRGGGREGVEGRGWKGRGGREGGGREGVGVIMQLKGKNKKLHNHSIKNNYFNMH